MSFRSRTLLRAQRSAVPVMASAIVGAAYLVGAIVFSAVSQPAADADRSSVITLNFDRPVRETPESNPIAQADEALPQPRNVEIADFVTPVSLDMPPPVFVSDRQEEVTPRIALVIDDVGLDLAASRRITSLEAAMTVAILPYAPAASRVASEAAEAGLDVLVHMPMEPLGLADPGPNALHLSLAADDLRARTLWAFARVPGAIGLNNHMGSRFTQDPSAMRTVLAAVSGENSIFLDSKTAAESRGAAVGRGLGMPVLERDIFLDHLIDRTQIAVRLDEAETLARTRGWAIVIGHPHDETLDVLEDWLPGASERGLEFVTVSELSAWLEEDGRREVQTSALQ